MSNLWLKVIPDDEPWFDRDTPGIGTIEPLCGMRTTSNSWIKAVETDSLLLRDMADEYDYRIYATSQRVVGYIFYTEAVKFNFVCDVEVDETPLHQARIDREFKWGERVYRDSLDSSLAINQMEQQGYQFAELVDAQRKQLLDALKMSVQ